MLGAVGFHCDERAGAEEGIRFCQESNPDVVVMEASSVKAAKEFLRLVRYQGRSQRMPVVILYSEKPNMETVAETIIKALLIF